MIFADIIPFTKEIIATIFLICAVAAFTRILFKEDDEDKKWQKIFGSLIILISALISNNGWAMSIAVVIGGLIVASEDFMKFVAAIYRSDPNKVAEIINAFKTEKASPKEVDDKLRQDAKEEQLQIIPVLEEPTKQTLSEKAKERIAQVKRVEDLVQSYLEQHIKGYEPHVRISNGEESIIVDGIIKKNNGKVGAIVEIRYITEKSFPALKFLISNFIGKLVRCGIKRRILVPVVSEEMTLEAAQKMQIENYRLASMMFFRLKDDQLELILK